MLIMGGKGGFGANLRAQGRTAVKKSTTTFSYCRDLNGRRLKSVNDEARLRAWLSREEAAKRTLATNTGGVYKEPAGSTGISGWHLGVPNWAEGAPDKGGWQRPRKTSLCTEWLASRSSDSRPPPPGAPRSWGCPRGRACEYAHGEEELRGEAKLLAAAAQKEMLKREAEMGLERYTKGIYLYSHGGEGGASDMFSTVLLGEREREGKAGGDRSGSMGIKRRFPDGDEGENDNEVSSTCDLFTFRRSKKSLGADSEGLARLGPVVIGDTETETKREIEAGQETSLPPIPLDTPFESHQWCSLTSNQALGDALFEYKHFAVTSIDGAAQDRIDGSSGGGLLTSADHSTVEVSGVGDFSTVIVPGVEIVSDSRDGAFYYEVELLTCSGVVQVGWCSSAVGSTSSLWAPKTEDGNGVGDDMNSWSFDGSRCLKFNGESMTYGKKWGEGDIIGCTLNTALQPHTVSFSLNGASLGQAFVIAPNDMLRFYPALSLEAGEVVRVNIGQTGFAYPPIKSANPVYSAKRKLVVSILSAAPTSTAVAPCSTNSLPAPSEPSMKSAEISKVNLEEFIQAAESIMASSSCPCPMVVEDLRQGGVTMAELGESLSKRGCKAGGTWEERAMRLLFIVGKKSEDIPKSLIKK